MLSHDRDDEGDLFPEVQTLGQAVLELIVVQAEVLIDACRMLLSLLERGALEDLLH